MNTATKTVAVIGSGLGGLSVAARLAKLGFKVDIYESSNIIGGKAGELGLEGFRFDTGPTLVTMISVFEKLFRDCGENISDYLNFRKLDSSARYFFPDGEIINAYSDKSKLIRELTTKARVSTEQINSYFDYAKRIYDRTHHVFLEKSLDELSTYTNLETAKSILLLYQIDGLRSMHSSLSSFFDDPKLIQLFSRYATYNGSDPYQTPATLNIISYIEHELGGYYPEGGIYQIPQAIARLATKLGVNIHLQSPVEQILTEHNKVKGIKVAGQKLDYDLVISNADVSVTYEKLLGDTKTRSYNRYKKSDKSSSALVFYWGVDQVFSQFDIHNVLFSADYRAEFQHIFGTKDLTDDPTVYISISNRYNKSDAPPGKDNYFVMINTPPDSGQNWEDLTKYTRTHILQKISDVTGVSLADHIVAEAVLTPPEIESRTSSLHGSLYGISSNSKLSAFFRHSNRSRDYSGLYFVGGSVHPGGGMPLVLISADIATQLICKYTR